MALLTIPSITKGAPSTIVLNKAELFSLAPVAADAYFSDPSNVFKCIVEYSSTVGAQRKRLVFDLADASPEAIFYVTLKGRNNFQIRQIILEDFDGGFLALINLQIPSGYDINIV